MDKDTLLANHEMGTYLDGLKDALTMNKADIKRAIKIIEEA